MKHRYPVPQIDMIADGRSAMSVKMRVAILVDPNTPPQPLGTWQRFPNSLEARAAAERRIARWRRSQRRAA